MPYRSLPNTLRQSLTQRKSPVITELVPRQNARNHQWPVIQGSNISEWKNFNLNHLDPLLKYMLDQDFLRSAPVLPSADDRLRGLHMRKMNDLLAIIHWNDDMATSALSYAKEHLQIQPGIVLLSRVAKTTGPPIVKTANGTFHVDHIVYLDTASQSSLYVGLARPATKILPNTIGEDSTDSQLLPLRQLAQQCMNARTQYGYIQTEESLLVCRFDVVNENNLSAAVKSIPWSTFGESQLTTDLALWILGMMALQACTPPTLNEVSPSWDVQMVHAGAPTISGIKELEAADEEIPRLSGPSGPSGLIDTTESVTNHGNGLVRAILATREMRIQIQNNNTVATVKETEAAFDYRI